MSRIRSIKPGFFQDEDLFDAEIQTGLPLRVAFAGLWCHADRDGRFEWRPRQLKAGILPYDDVDFSRVLDALTTRGWIVRYEVDGRVFGLVRTFKKHQFVNNRESESLIPPPDDSCVETAENHARMTRGARVDHACPTRHDLAQGEGEGKGKGMELLPSGACSEPLPGRKRSKPNQEPDPGSGLLFPLKTHSSPENQDVPDSWELPLKKLNLWKRTYPAVGIESELAKAAAWLDANPTRRKTARGMPAYLVGWLGRAWPREPAAASNGKGDPRLKDLNETALKAACRPDCTHCQNGITWVGPPGRSQPAACACTRRA